MIAEFRNRVIKIFILTTGVLVGLAVIAGAVFLFQKNRAINIEKINSEGGNLIVSPLPSKSEEMPLNFSFVGDIMLDRNVGALIKKNGFDFLFEKIKGADFLKNKDLICANLEGAVTNNGQHYPPNNGLDFAFLPNNVSRLKDYGFNFFNLANNHFADQGQRGIDETRSNLDGLGFNYAGCPDGQVGDCSTKILNIKNKKIGFADFSAVYSGLKLDDLINIVKQLKANTDFVIVNFHWGKEYQHNFSLIQQEYAHTLIDAGTDLIVGHHPHVVQGIEIYKGKPIFYSLGNFVFDQYFSMDTQQELGLEIRLTDSDIQINLVPFTSSHSQPELAHGIKKATFLADLVEWSNIEPIISEQIKLGKINLNR